jgi:hypothetical protein
LTLDDAITYAEGAFTCEMGMPARWADLAMTKPYQMVEVAAPDDERLASSMMINALSSLKSNAGFSYQATPRLYWRWADKIRWEDGVMSARVYLDGNPGPTGTPSRPKGRPIGGQYRLAAGTDTEAVAA